MLYNLKSFATDSSLAALCVICVIGSGISRAQAQASVNVLTYQDIPRICVEFCAEERPYKSWSLFLICNPRWMLENGDKGIRDLFIAYYAFSRAIGPYNLAVWFS